jgi:hypothetical protein
MYLCTGVGDAPYYVSTSKYRADRIRIFYVGCIYTSNHGQ